MLEAFWNLQEFYFDFLYPLPEIYIQVDELIGALTQGDPYHARVQPRLPDLVAHAQALELRAALAQALARQLDPPVARLDRRVVARQLVLELADLVAEQPRALAARQLLVARRVEPVADRLELPVQRLQLVVGRAAGRLRLVDRRAKR